jgi:hypothetical protein
MSSAKLPEVRLRHMLETIDGILNATDGMTAAEVTASFVIAGDRARRANHFGSGQGAAAGHA